MSPESLWHPMPWCLSVAEHLSGLTLCFPGVLVKAKDISQTEFWDSLVLCLFANFISTKIKIKKRKNPAEI